MQVRISLVLMAAFFASVAHAQGIAPITTCDTAGIGQAQLVSDLPTFAFTNPPNDTSVTITSVSTGTTDTPGGTGSETVETRLTEAPRRASAPAMA